MQGANNGKKHQCAGNDVSGKKQEKQEIAKQQHPLSRKTVHDVSAENPCDKCHDGVARKYDADGLLVCIESVGKINGEQGCEQHEREENHEIGNPDFQIIAIPQFFGG